MTKPYLPLLAVVLFLRAASAWASVELVLPVSSFTLESQALGPSSPVEVSGTQSGKGLAQLTVKAFGKTYSLDAAQLKRLEGVEVNGLELSYAGGSPVIGGRQLYLQLSRGAVQRRITFAERGDITIEEPAHR